MSDDVVVTGPKVTVGFERKLQLPKKYESATASVYVSGTIDDFRAVDEEDLVNVIREAFFAGKTAVFEQLGLTFKVLNMVAVEKLEEAGIPAIEITSAEEHEIMAQANVRVDTDEARPDAPEGEELWLELQEHPDWWYDQRSTKKGRQPDFKRQGKGEGLWLGSKSNPAPDGFVVPAGDVFAVRS